MNSSITLRKTVETDRNQLFKWRNLEIIIGLSSSQRAVTWHEHCRWFDESLVSATRRIYIILIDKTPGGAIRFDKSDNGECVISVYLLPPWVGRGLGVIAIKMGCEQIFQSWTIQRIIACVRNENMAGIRGFLKSGFKQIDPPSTCPSGHFCFAKTRDIITNTI